MVWVRMCLIGPDIRTPALWLVAVSGRLGLPLMGKCVTGAGHSFCFLLAFEDVSPQIPALDTVPAGRCISLPPCHDGLLSLWNCEAK